jgi:polar amino acid transport system substrate-binding protein
MSIFSSSKIYKTVTVIVITLTLFAIPLNTNAQEPKFEGEIKPLETKKLIVTTKIAPPLVMDKSGSLEGFSIDLWKEISKRNNYQTDFVMKTNVKEMLDSLVSHENDLAIAAISQTADREKIVDFSQPYLNAGLEILVRANETSVFDQVLAFLQSGAMRLLLFGLLAIFILSNIHYLYRKIRGYEQNQNYFLSIWDSIWWLFNGFFRTEFGDQSNRLHQLISTLMIIVSIIFITQFQAMVTADLTLDKIDNKITSIADIKGKSVGVTASTTAEKFAEDNEIKFEKFENNDKLLEALIKEKTDAVILDAPIAKYYATQDGKGKVNESISLNREHYSVAFPIGSALRKEVNQAILSIEQDGTMSQLTKKWFGQE